MEHEVKIGYYYGMRFDKDWLIRGLKELINHIKINQTNNITYYFPINSKHFYILYDENLIKGNSNIESFKKCNHWIYIRDKLDSVFNFIIQHICEFIDHPRKIFHFEV